MLRSARLALLLLVCGPHSGARAAPSRVLFIGNSHTYSNDLPGLFTGLAETAGRVVEVDQSTFGGYTLQQHAATAATLDKIALGHWDHVVLQEHSLYPTIDYWWQHSSLPAARLLDSLIVASESATALFVTWGWEDGGSHCVQGYCSPDYADYFAMQDAVTAACLALDQELGSFLVPAGAVWARALSVDPLSPLWAPDGYHPSPEGSYLAACVFFARVFEQSPEGLGFYGGIDPDRAIFYQGIAAEVLTGAPPEAPPIAAGLAVHPNPFNPRTNLEFSLREERKAVLCVYDAAGRRVDRLDLGRLAPGPHRIPWDARDRPSGLYLCRLSTDERALVRKMLLIR